MNESTFPTTTSSEQLKPPPEFLKLLNRTTLENLDQIFQEDPSADLRSPLRIQLRDYRIECEKELKKDDPPVPSDPDAAERWKSFMPVHGALSVQYPLSPVLEDLLREPCQQPDDEYKESSSSSPSRIKLLRLLEKGDWIHQLWGKAVVKITPHIIVKICKAEGKTDLMNLAHVRAYNSICKVPVPEPLGLLQDQRRFYSFMTYVPGVMLEKIWKGLSSTQKGNVRCQLNPLLSGLRRIPLPSKGGLLGAGDPLCCRDGRRWTRKSDGPVKNAQEFNDFLLGEHFTDPAVVELVRPLFKADYRVVMTHGDLHPRNILVDDKDNLNIVGVIDWDAGGGYPEYWEYVKALKTAFYGEAPDWHQYLPEDGIGKYAEEYARDLMLGRLVGGNAG